MNEVDVESTQDPKDAAHDEGPAATPGPIDAMVATEDEPPIPRPAVQTRPTEPIIIVGGGRVGRALMRKFARGIVLETDPAKIDKLRAEFGDARVSLGSGTSREHLDGAGLATASAVVAATHTDETNYKVAYTARHAGVGKVIARVDDGELQARFTAIGAEPVTAPLTACINMIANMLSPERRSIGEGVIGDGAPTVGSQVAELDLPLGTIIVSILRGDHLIAPQDDERLQAGDVVTILTEDKEELQPTLERITGRNLSMNPLDRLYVVMDGPTAFSTAFREAFVLAQYASAEIFVVAPEDAHELVKEAKRLCDLDGIAFDSAMFPRATFHKDFVSLVRREDESEVHGGLEDGIFFECVVIAPKPTTFLNRVLGRSPIDPYVKSLDHPIMIARNLKPYKSILLLIDDTHRTSMNIAHTIDMALVYGSDITALVPEAAAGEEAFRLLRYLKRAGRIYGVQVHDRLIKGNPTIEFIREVKSGDYDVIVMDWHARSVKRDIIRRVLEYGPKSTIVLP